MLDNLTNPIIFVPLMGWVGACFGSFITLVSYRWPRDLPWISARSRCAACGAALGPKQLIPVFSYIFQKGQAACCGAPIHWRYPAIELVCALALAGLAYVYGVSWLFLLFSSLILCLICLIVTDFEHYIIPDQIQIALLILGVAYTQYLGVFWLTALLHAAAGLLVGMALRYGFLWLWKKDGLGMGDVKFLGVSALWIGAAALVPFLFFSGLVGIVTAGLWRILGRGAVFPFGPALAVSLAACIFFPSITAGFWQLGPLLNDWLGLTG